MASGRAVVTIGAIDPGQNTVTRPAPPLNAARAARIAAPALPRDPATTATRPKSPLCESMGRTGSEAATSPASER